MNEVTKEINKQLLEILKGVEKWKNLNTKVELLETIAKINSLVNR